MKQYSVGDQLKCDFHFGGKPKARCVEVLEPGTGQRISGKVRVQLTETQGAYRKGEILDVSCWLAVPIPQLRAPGRGEFFTRVDTQYEWVQKVA